MAAVARLALVLALLLLPAPIVASQAQDDDACEARPDVVTCLWIFDAQDRALGATQESANATNPTYDFPLPVFERTLATIVVVRDGPDNGWTFAIEEVYEEDGEPRARNVSASQHAQQVESTTNQQKTSHLLFTRADAEYWLRFTPGNPQVRQTALPLDLNTPSRYQISYIAERLPEGVAPSRPAGTQDDPHLVDVRGEVAAADHDIVAAWFDDARLGDGLMDVHLQVRSLESVTFTSPVSQETAERVDWKVVFYVRGQGYYVAWEATRTDAGDVAFACALRYESETETQSEEVLLRPDCLVDREAGVFHASFPTRTIGPPADGEVFEKTTARSRLHKPLGLSGDMLTVSRSPIEVMDDDPARQYDFALGGPTVWSKLDGGRKDPAVPVAPAWHEAPLASENLPDTLQVGGALLALVTFVLGVLFLARARRDTRRLLARIDQVEQQHERDAKRALIELGRLENELTRDFRRGRIREAQYQVAAQRIASAAARMALRRDTGLDDGIPDARVVPVLDASPDAPRRQI